MKTPERIIISRTDSIGDVVLTLPVAGMIKQYLPDSKVWFLGRDYTRAVVEMSSYVDEFISWDNLSQKDEKERLSFFKSIGADAIIHVFPRIEIAKLARAAGIQKRIGASGRLYHYRYCNKIVPLSRRNSELHESQLNLKLLKPLASFPSLPGLNLIHEKYGLVKPGIKNSEIEQLIDKNKFNLVLHPKSKGSAREWPIGHFNKLVELVPKERIKIFVTGTMEEGLQINDFLLANKNNLTDLTGRFSLDELIAFIANTDGLVAASTGPLHIAAAMGKLAVGIYPPIRPMHPGRWSPLGENAHSLVADKKCNDCRNSLSCSCMSEVTPQHVLELILKNVG